MYHSAGCSYSFTISKVISFIFTGVSFTRLLHIIFVVLTFILNLFLVILSIYLVDQYLLFFEGSGYKEDVVIEFQVAQVFSVYYQPVFFDVYFTEDDILILLLTVSVILSVLDGLIYRYVMRENVRLFNFPEDVWYFFYVFSLYTLFFYCFGVYEVECIIRVRKSLN